MAWCTLALIYWLCTKSATPSVTTNAYRCCIAANDCWCAWTSICALSAVTLRYSFGTCFAWIDSIIKMYKKNWFISTSDLKSFNLPDHPGAHLHVNLPSPSKHIPLFLQGFGKQSFKSWKKLLFWWIGNKLRFLKTTYCAHNMDRWIHGSKDKTVNFLPFHKFHGQCIEWMHLNFGRNSLL